MRIETGLPVAPDGGGSRSVAEAERNRVTVPDSRVAELLAAVEGPDVSRKRGSGEIHGRVVDGEDVGVEGVLLRATRRVRSSSGRSPSASASTNRTCTRATKSWCGWPSPAMTR